MAKSRAQQAAIAISMKKAGKKPKSLPKAQKGGQKVKTGPDYRHMRLVHWTDDYNTKQDSSDYKKGYYKGISDIKKGKPKSKTLYDPSFGIIPQRLGYSEAYERNKPKSKITKTTTKKKG